VREVARRELLWSTYPARWEIMIAKLVTFASCHTTPRESKSLDRSPIHWDGARGERPNVALVLI